MFESLKNIQKDYNLANYVRERCGHFQREMNESARVTRCQAVARGFLVRRRMKNVLAQFKSIVLEIEGPSASLSGPSASLSGPSAFLLACSDSPTGQRSNVDSNVEITNDHTVVSISTRTLIDKVPEPPTGDTPAADAKHFVPRDTSDDISVKDVTPASIAVDAKSSSTSSSSSSPSNPPGDFLVTLESLDTLHNGEISSDDFERTLQKLTKTELEDLKVKTAYELIWVHDLIQTRKSYLKV